LGGLIASAFDPGLFFERDEMAILHEQIAGFSQMRSLDAENPRRLAKRYAKADALAGARLMHDEARERERIFGQIALILEDTFMKHETLLACFLVVLARIVG
jgi:hypothetical protein